MTAMNMGPALPMSVTMMAAMMLPSAVPAVTRLARGRDGVIAAPRFAGGYLASWTLVGVVVYLVYRPPAAIAAGALVIGAGLYELTPIKRECRRRCREHVRSGVRFGVYCFGSSIGLMLVLIAVDLMSIALMVVIAVVVLAQKLFAPHPAVDVPVALAIVGLGIAIATT
jgi:predicted metal-binding membrane protein